MCFRLSNSKFYNVLYTKQINAFKFYDHSKIFHIYNLRNENAIFSESSGFVKEKKTYNVTKASS